MGAFPKSPPRRGNALCTPQTFQPVGSASACGSCTPTLGQRPLLSQRKATRLTCSPASGTRAAAPRGPSASPSPARLCCRQRTLCRCPVERSSGQGGHRRLATSPGSGFRPSQQVERGERAEHSQDPRAFAARPQGTPQNIVTEDYGGTATPPQASSSRHNTGTRTQPQVLPSIVIIGTLFQTALFNQDRADAICTMC